MARQKLRLPLGISDFRGLRREERYFVDKTPLIEAVIDANAQVLLLPRPRRFGKTTNLTMLRYFFEKSPEDRTELFAGLAVASSEIARPHFQRYPVIFMSFKDVKPTSWEDCLARMANVLADAYRQHRYLLEEGGLTPEEADVFTAILHARATRAHYVDALGLLVRLVAEHHKEQVVLLLDEYDTPIHAGYTNHYYGEVVAFFRDFFSGGLKDNPHLFRGVLTGILRVAKESLFSGLNNLGVYSLLRSEFAPYFGFTEPEVSRLVEAMGQPELLSGIREYYNGYLFGGLAIYNPWSVMSFLDSAKKELLPYWIETSSNDLVRELLLTGASGMQTELEALLAGGTIDKPIEENIVLRDLDARPDAVWSFLLFTGYLNAVEVYLVDGFRRAKLAVPNREVGIALHGMVYTWLSTQVGGSDEVERLLQALLGGDGPTVERYLSKLMRVNASYFDTAAPEPERFYHGLVVGLLASLGSRYEVRSNRESGFGRCDVMVSPTMAGQPGVVLELKTVEEGETPERALAAALRQIRERDYAAELRARGASPIHAVAAVFDGKRAWVKVAGATARKGRPAAKKTARGGKRPRSR